MHTTVCAEVVLRDGKGLNGRIRHSGVDVFDFTCLSAVAAEGVRLCEMGKVEFFFSIIIIPAHGTYVYIIVYASYTNDVRYQKFDTTPCKTGEQHRL